MGRSLDVYVGYALYPYVEDAESNVFVEMAEKAELEDPETDEWVFHCFREVLGLPDLSDQLALISHLGYGEWEHHPTAKLWSDQRAKARQAQKDLGVDIGFSGVGDYMKPVLYYTNLYVRGDWEPCKVPTFSDEEEAVAREALMTFAGVLRLDEYYDRIGRDMSEDIGLMAWSSYG